MLYRNGRKFYDSTFCSASTKSQIAPTVPKKICSGSAGLGPVSFSSSSKMSDAASESESESESEEAAMYSSPSSSSSSSSLEPISQDALTLIQALGCSDVSHLSV